MKKYTILAVILVLTATVFTGCRSRRPNPTEMPHTETIMPSIAPTEMPTTVPATEHATEHTSVPTENPGTIPGDADTTMGTEDNHSNAATGETGNANESRSAARNTH